MTLIRQSLSGLICFAKKFDMVGDDIRATEDCSFNLLDKKRFGRQGLSNFFNSFGEKGDE